MENIKIESIEQSFKFFYKWRYKTNEFYLKFKPHKIPTNLVNTFYYENLYEEIKDSKIKESPIMIVKKEAIERFHPNKINNKNFWQLAKINFPLLNVCGGEVKNIKQANQRTLDFSKSLNLFSFLLELIEKNNNSLKILEIGFGFGNVFFEIKDKCEYVGIDYVIPKFLKKHKNFFEIEESGVPLQLYEKNFYDVIYCVNVLQHCSQKDRFMYLKQGYDILKPGGYFIFGCFLMTRENENESYWSIKNSNNRAYTIFFNQLTEVDYDYELKRVLDNIGYKMIGVVICVNYAGIIVQKPL